MNVKRVASGQGRSRRPLLAKSSLPHFLMYPSLNILALSFFFFLLLTCLHRCCTFLLIVTLVCSTSDKTWVRGGRRLSFTKQLRSIALKAWIHDNLTTERHQVTITFTRVLPIDTSIFRQVSTLAEVCEAIPSAGEELLKDE